MVGANRSVLKEGYFFFASLDEADLYREDYCRHRIFAEMNQFEVGADRARWRYFNVGRMPQST